MPKMTKNKRRRSAFSAETQPPLKQRILRRAFRAFPFVMHGFFLLTILTLLATIGSIGWQAFAQSGGGAFADPAIADETTNSQTVNFNNPTHADKLLLDYFRQQERIKKMSRWLKNSAKKGMIDHQAFERAKEKNRPQVWARISVWDSKNQRMTERLIYSDGSQEMTR